VFVYSFDVCMRSPGAASYLGGASESPAGSSPHPVYVYPGYLDAVMCMTRCIFQRI